MHAALHHCDVDRTISQIHRVLRPGGKAAFIEDYAYHPLMNLYRRLTPHKHTETERALTDEDLAQIVSRFTAHHFTYSGLFNFTETATHPVSRAVRPILRSLDDALYRWFPPIKKYSRLVGIFLTK